VAPLSLRVYDVVARPCQALLNPNRQLARQRRAASARAAAPGVVWSNHKERGNGPRMPGAQARLCRESGEAAREVLERPGPWQWRRLRALGGYPQCRIRAPVHPNAGLLTKRCSRPPCLGDFPPQRVPTAGSAHTGVLGGRRLSFTVRPLSSKPVPTRPLIICYTGVSPNYFRSLSVIRL
jgi:hypothetical protein